HVPVKSPRASARFFHAIAVSIVSVSECPGSRGGAGNAVFGVIGGRDIVRGIENHVSGSIVAVTGELVIDERWSVQEFCAALGDGLIREIAPRVVAVAVAPVFGLGIHRTSGAVCAGVLG